VFKTRIYIAKIIHFEKDLNRDRNILLQISPSFAAILSNQSFTREKLDRVVDAIK